MFGGKDVEGRKPRGMEVSEGNLNGKEVKERNWKKGRAKELCELNNNKDKYEKESSRKYSKENVAHN